jgi:hypothetical protein
VCAWVCVCVCERVCVGDVASKQQELTQVE